MELGIIAALPQEAATLFSGRIRPMKLYSLGGHASVICSGMGADNASKAAEHLVVHGVGRVLSWGLAGALTEALKLGDLIIPKTVLANDLKKITVDPAWQQHVRKRLDQHFSIHQGDLAHTEKILPDRHSKMNLHSRTNAIAADMESAAIAGVAGHAGIPFMALRVIIDPVEMLLPKMLLNSVTQYGQLEFLKLCSAFLRRPNELISTIKLAVHSQKALWALRSAAEQLQPDFCQPRI